MAVAPLSSAMKRLMRLRITVSRLLERDATVALTR